MPNLTSAAATLRSSRFSFSGYLSVPPQTVALRGTLSATPTFPATTLAYTNVSGSHTNVTAGMTVRVLSSGVLKGLLRIASSGTIGAASLPVNEFSANTCNAASGDTIEVIQNDRRIWDKLVSATAALNKDSRIAYSDQGANPPPVVCSGGAYANFTDNVAGGVNFYGSTSWVLDPDSGGSMTHAWSFPGATPNTSTDADPSAIALATGFTMATHTVTDSSNSKSTTQYVPIRIYERTGANAPLSVRLDSLNANVQSGWSASFSLPLAAQADIDALPDGAMIVYFEEERYNGAVASYGSAVTGRSHIKFVGYLVRSSIHVDAESDEVTFEAVSPLGILENTPALPQLMISDSTPSKWSEIKSLTMKRAAWYLLYWGSTYTDIFDFIWSDASDLSYSRLAIQEVSSLGAQLNDLTQSINAPVTCDRLGRLLVSTDGNYLSSSDRAARTKTYDFTTADIISIDIPQEHRGTVKHVRGEGITTAGKAVFSNAGNAPAWFGTGSETLSKQIVATQAVLNTRTGYHFARVNALYDGRFVPKGATLVLPDGYDVFDPALREFATITLADTTNARGVAFTTDTRWTVEQVSISYNADDGTKDIRLTLDHETTGASGVTYIPPQASENGLSDFPPLDLNFPPLDVVGGAIINVGTQTVAVFTSDSHLWITTDFNTPEASGGPTYTDQTLTSIGTWPGGTLIGMVVDAYSPLYLGTGTTVNGWIVTTTHVARINDIFGTVSFSNSYALRATSSKRVIQTERGQQNFVIVATWYDADGTWAAITTDGINWTEVQVTAQYLTVLSNSNVPALYVSPHTANKAIVGVWTTTGGTTTAVSKFYYTTNAGSTWAELVTPVTTPGVYATALAIPFTNTAENTLFYRNSTAAATPPAKLYRNNTNISPTYGGNEYGPRASGSYRLIAIQDDNANDLCFVGQFNSSIVNGVFRTRNALATAPTWDIVVAPASSTTWQQIYSVGKGVYILIGASGSVGVLDSSDVIDVRTGNISTGGNVVALCGG
jgi:hypothetical protein